MYQVFCLQGTPPETLEEQDKCFRSKTRCWRLSEQKKASSSQAAAGTQEEPVKVSRNEKRASRAS